MLKIYFICLFIEGSSMSNIVLLHFHIAEKVWKSGKATVVGGSEVDIWRNIQKISVFFPHAINSHILNVQAERLSGESTLCEDIALLVNLDKSVMMAIGMLQGRLIAPFHLIMHIKCVHTGKFVF